jgi:hypothetical protein
MIDKSKHSSRLFTSESNVLGSMWEEDGPISKWDEGGLVYKWGSDKIILEVPPLSGSIARLSLKYVHIIF